MSTTIHDILQLPCMRGAKVVTGSELLNRTVTSITVLEYSRPDSLQSLLQRYEGPRYNELSISGMFDIADDPEAQCAVIRELMTTGVFAMILYYLGIGVKKLEPCVIRTAEELGFILITMPKNLPGLRYSDAIMEISALIHRDRERDTYFIPELLDQFSMLLEQQRSTDTLLRLISDRTQMSIFLADTDWHIHHYATWPAGIPLDLRGLVDQVVAQPDSLDLFGHAHSYKVVRLKSHSGNLNMIALAPDPQHLQAYVKQIGELVCLSDNIWGVQRGNSGANELIRSLVLGEPLRIRRLAKLVGVSLQGLNSMWIIHPDRPDDKKNAAAFRFVLDRTKKIAQDTFTQSIVGQYDGSVIMIARQADSQTLRYVETALSEAVQNNNAPFHVFVYHHMNEIQDFHDAYLNTESNAAHAVQVFPLRSAMSKQELQFAGECYNLISQGEAVVQRCMDVLSPLSYLNGQLCSLLRNTLAAFLLDAESSITKTAELLYVHKNTVKYRLNKINSIMCNDCTKAPLSCLIVRAIAIQRLLAGQ